MAVSFQDTRVICLIAVMWKVKPIYFIFIHLFTPIFYIIFSLLGLAPMQGLGSLLKEAFDATINFPKVLIIGLKFDRSPIDLHESISIDDFAIVDLICIICFGQNVLDPRPGVDKSFPHPIIFQRDDVSIVVVVARGIEIVEGFVEPLYLNFLLSADDRRIRRRRGVARVCLGSAFWTRMRFRLV